LDAILPIFLKATYDHGSGVHNLWGLLASAVLRPATHPACYDLVINAEASRINRVCAKTVWAALLQDSKAYKAAERGVKVFIVVIGNDMWICDLRDPKTFYSNVTALVIFNHLCKHFGGLHVLDMVLLTTQMNQYYKGMTDIPEYIFTLEDAQQKGCKGSSAHH
jgi:hypothetical protein